MGPLGARLLWRGWVWLVSLALMALVVGYWVWLAHRPHAPGADAVWLQAEADFNAGGYERVQSALDRLQRLRQPTPLDCFLRAQLAMAQQHNDQALDDLARVPDQHDMAALARLLAGQCEMRRDRVLRAEEYFKAALALHPGLVQAHRELIYIYGIQLRRAELRADCMALWELNALTFAHLFLWCFLRNDSWGRRETAASLARYVTADPSDRRSRLALTENYLRLGCLDDAESTIAPVPRDNSETIALQAWIALYRGEPEDAERLLLLLPSDDPLSARIRGILALGRRDVQTALRNFRISYAADPDNRETIFGLVAALELSGDPKAAERLRESARRLEKLDGLIKLAAAPDARRDADLMRQLGAACAAVNRRAEARAWYTLAIALDPLDSKSQQALFRLNDLQVSGQQSPRPPPAP
jgi:tetratricopeptide (TPR) repeat protein